MFNHIIFIYSFLCLSISFFGGGDADGYRKRVERHKEEEKDLISFDLSDMPDSKGSSEETKVNSDNLLQEDLIDLRDEEVQDLLNSEDNSGIKKEEPNKKEEPIKKEEQIKKEELIKIEELIMGEPINKINEEELKKIAEPIKTEEPIKIEEPIKKEEVLLIDLDFDAGVTDIPNQNPKNKESSDISFPVDKGSSVEFDLLTFENEEDLNKTKSSETSPVLLNKTKSHTISNPKSSRGAAQFTIETTGFGFQKIKLKPVNIFFFFIV